MFKGTYYSINDDGTQTEVYPLEKCIAAIKTRDADQTAYIVRLEKQITELQDECYKDKRLQKLTEALNEMRADARRGFPISAKESEAIAAWKEEHDTNEHGNPSQYHGVSGGGYTYEFYPTGLGTFSKCICDACSNRAFREAEGDIKKYENLLRQYKGVFEFENV